VLHLDLEEIFDQPILHWINDHDLWADLERGLVETYGLLTVSDRDLDTPYLSVR
jgi:hypothetical protein